MHSLVVAALTACYVGINCTSYEKCLVINFGKIQKLQSKYATLKDILMCVCL